jgi:peptide/nickel transport system permease protein
VITFLLMNLKKPEDIARSVLAREITNDQIARFVARHQLDRPVLVRYFEWIGNLLRGDLGNSIATGRPVSADVFTRLQRSLTLAGIAALIGVTGGICSVCSLRSVWEHRPTSVASRSFWYSRRCRNS